MAEFLKLRMLTNQSLLACTVCGRFYLKSVFIEDLRQIWHNATYKTHRMLFSKLFKGFSDICWGHYVGDILSGTLCWGHFVQGHFVVDPVTNTNYQ